MLCFSFMSVTPAFAEWTGDKKDGMVSNVIIKKVHTGQIDRSPYFCFFGTKRDGANISACQIKTQSVWKESFDMLYNQVMYYYSTGQQVRVYYAPNNWHFKPFTDSLTSNVLVGLSTCESEAHCYGPERKKP
ncbi:subtilase family AB5 toxin binding subunit [Citrobacter sp. Cb027]|uniref:subtilase family AB5 toxin binding subunit n=1 Tax=Citrobacter sp. Cb027 TaxID=2985023 RepID=UPI0025823C38|nr:subtilase family AB5 toxin binding subunit [Citrobacter sp. Cb027]